MLQVNNVQYENKYSFRDLLLVTYSVTIVTSVSLRYGMSIASKPMAMQPAIARQNWRGVWLYKPRISDFFEEATEEYSS